MPPKVTDLPHARLVRGRGGKKWFLCLQGESGVARYPTEAEAMGAYAERFPESPRQSEEKNGESLSKEPPAAPP